MGGLLWGREIKPAFMETFADELLVQCSFVGSGLNFRFWGFIGMHIAACFTHFCLLTKTVNLFKSCTNIGMKTSCFLLISTWKISSACWLEVSNCFMLFWFVMGCYHSKKPKTQGYEDPTVLAAETPCKYQNKPLIFFFYFYLMNRTSLPLPWNDLHFSMGLLQYLCLLEWLDCYLGSRMLPKLLLFIDYT